MSPTLINFVSCVSGSGIFHQTKPKQACVAMLGFVTSN